MKRRIKQRYPTITVQRALTLLRALDRNAHEFATCGNLQCAIREVRDALEDHIRAALRRACR